MQSVQNVTRETFLPLPRMQELAKLAAGSYRRATPFPHAIFDDFFDPAMLELVLSEGRNRQVRKMLQAVGHPVQKLRRIRYGGVDLGRLPAGGLRPLRPAEVERLKRVTRRKRSS